jgi:two-component system chemotaxis sensor kinase CheA
MDDLVSDFVLEAAETLAGLQAGLCALSMRRGDVNTVPDMLRRLHGLKGLCGFVGLPQAEAVAHAAEDLLTVASLAPQVPDSVTLSMIAEMIARLGQLLGDATLRHIETDGGDEELITALEVLVADMQPEPGERRTRAPWCGLDTLARALGDRLGKRVDLVVGGDDLRIDLAAAPAVRTALIALVRNACDHGVEVPSERRALGKPTLSILHLTVRRTADGLAIDMTDDGRGVDPGRVRARLVALGRFDAQAAAALSDASAQEQVFVPGVSTAETLTALSGRGLGLDLVRREVEKLGGRIELNSTPGRGCRFTLALPKDVLAGPSARRQAAA